MKLNLKYATLAFALAVVVWYSVSGREKVEIWLEFPVQFTGMPESLIIRRGLVSKIDVRVRGPKGLVKGLEEKKINFTLDLGHIKEGLNVYPIEAKDIPLARTFEVMEVNPPRMEIEADVLVTKTGPVKPAWQAVLEPDFKLLEASTQPTTVKIKGPQTLLRELDSVETQVLEITGVAPGVVQENVALKLSKELNATPNSVSLRLVFGAKTKEMSFQMPVDVENAGRFQASARPQRVTVRAEIPLSALRDKNWKDAISVRVFVPPDMRPGSQNLPCEVTLFSGAKLVKVEPATIEVNLKE